MDNVTERQIGEVFTVLEHHPANMPDHIVTVKCVEDNCWSCRHCYFFRNNCQKMRMKHGNCSATFRKDKRNVAFEFVSSTEM